jgi:peptidoglycan/LPS O-acetylase OafA/YrhL
VIPLLGIDLMRGLASLWVAVFHLNAVHPTLPDAYHRWVARGWLGVWVFFVVSGFCIAASAAREASFRRFAWRRLWRIFPPYWVSVMLVLAVIAVHLAVARVNDVTGVPRGPAAWALTLLALVRPASAVGPVNWVYWSLPYELGFYLIVGTALAVGSFRKAFLAAFGLLAGCLIVGLPHMSFLEAWLCFSLGMAVYHFTAGERRYGLALAVIAGLGLAASSATRGMIAISVVSAALILFFHSVALPAFPWGPWRRLGTISYSLYLTHVPVGVYLLAYFFDRGFSRRPPGCFLRDAILLSGCLVFAEIFYRLVEAPAHEIGRGGWNKFRDRAPPPP